MANTAPVYWAWEKQIKRKPNHTPFWWDERFRQQETKRINKIKIKGGFKMPDITNEIVTNNLKKK